MAKLTLDVPDEMATALEVLGREAGRTSSEQVAAILDDHLGEYARELARFHRMIADADANSIRHDAAEVFSSSREQELRERLERRVATEADAAATGERP